MLKITGMLEVSNGKYIKDPFAQLIPHLTFAGKMTCDVNLVVKTEVASEQVGAMGYQNIPVEGEVKEAYDALITALDKYVKADLEAKNPDLTIVIGGFGELYPEVESSEENAEQNP